MKNRLLFVFTILIASITLSSCSTTSRTSERRNTKTSSSSSKDVNLVLREAKKYLGTPYKYGGTSRSGMDCSGLVINSFDAVNYSMPRISRDQSNEGVKISLRQVKEGDLLFFRTSGSSISHVGIVESVKAGEVFFIHSSTSKGVIVSSLNEKYWNKRFVKATRVI